MRRGSAKVVMLQRLVWFAGLALAVAPMRVHAQTGPNWAATDYTSPVAQIWITRNDSVFVTAAPDHPSRATLTGVFSRSDDGGATWTDVQIPDGFMLEAVDLTDGTTLFAANEHGLHRSINAGTTWTQVFPVSGNQLTAAELPIRRVYISDADRNLIYVETSNTVYRSGDDGVTWTSLKLPKNDDPNPLCGLYPTALHPDGLDSRRLLYAAECRGPHGYSSRKVAMSLDAGDSWTTLSFDVYPFLSSGPARRSFENTVRNFSAGSSSAANRVYAVEYSDGIFVDLARSDDYGQTWIPSQKWRADVLTHPGATPQGFHVAASALAVDPTNPDHVYMSFGIDSDAVSGKDTSDQLLGVNESWDGGASWTSVGQSGLPGITRLAMSPDGTMLYGGTREGLYLLPLGSADGMSSTRSRQSSSNL